MTTPPQKTIKYYDGSYGNRPILLVIDTKKAKMYLTDFTFVHGDTQYDIILTKKGDNGQHYRMIIRGKSYVSNNVWVEAGTSKLDCEIIKIDAAQIKKNDIMLNSLDFAIDKQKIIDHYVATIEREKEKQRQNDLEQQEFWTDKQILATFCDDGCH